MCTVLGSFFSGWGQRRGGKFQGFSTHHTFILAGVLATAKPSSFGLLVLVKKENSYEFLGEFFLYCAYNCITLFFRRSNTTTMMTTKKWGKIDNAQTRGTCRWGCVEWLELFFSWEFELHPLFTSHHIVFRASTSLFCVWCTSHFTCNFQHEIIGSLFFVIIILNIIPHPILVAASAFVVKSQALLPVSLLNHKFLIRIERKCWADIGLLGCVLLSTANWQSGSGSSS